MKGLATKRTELKVDLLQDLENILFSGVCLHFLARIFFTGSGSEGVKDFDFKWVPSYNRHSQGGRVV